MRYTLLLIIALTVSGTVNAKKLKIKYPATAIADSLKSDAYAVIRLSETSYVRHSVERYSIDYHYVVTILDKKGDYAGYLGVAYDRNSEVTSFEGTIYNGFGIETDKLKKSDLTDQVYNGSSTLFSDNRLLTCKFSALNYPMTVEYTYRVEYDGVVGFSRWVPQRNYNISVERSILSFETPKDIDFRYKILNYKFEESKTEDDKVNRYRWEASNMIAEEYLPHSPNSIDYNPSILLAPNEIAYEGTEGDFSTWKSYGEWSYNLIKTQNNLPQEAIDKVRSLTDTIESKVDKVKAVYKYMQGTTRYINIALGIGGFKPIDAQEVYSKGYGDCKALSNYTRVLLETIGIESYYAEIGTGSSQQLKFPSFASANQTNHIILAVPLESDTIWLECTNQNAPFGFLGSSTSNRYALLITEEGGVLAKTTKLNSEANLREVNSTLDVTESGDAQFKLEANFKNCAYEEIFGLIYAGKEEQKKILLSNLEGNTKEISKYSVADISKDFAESELKVEGSIKKVGKKAGDRMLISPQYMLDLSLIKKVKLDRKLDIYISQDYNNSDILSISIPKGYQIENIPECVKLESILGDFSLDFKTEGDKIIATRRYSKRSGRYDSSSFKDINDFFSAVKKAINSKIIIKKV